jgi:two-component system CheB/CheR fusion protein
MTAKKTARQAAKPTTPVPGDPTSATAAGFPIVGIGASAGGVEAVCELLRHLPAEPGMAFVVAMHLDPKHASQLPQVFARASNVPVEEAKDGAVVERNRVYVAPASGDVRIEKSVLRVRPRAASVPHLPIDSFLQSLAEEQGARGIAVVLSGSASDGAAGITSVKEAGGITFAQDETAEYNSMPRSAIATGSVDFVLPPRDIARELVRVAHHSYVATGGAPVARLPQKELIELFELLHAAHDIDFNHYKPTTIERRIRRRMALHKIDTLAEYVALVRAMPQELDSLYDDILIRVTAFFRDPEVFDALRAQILPLLFNGRDDQLPMRIWVPGCSTGEEVYSLAMTMLEMAEHHQSECPIQIFGTDVSDAAIEHARHGVYPAAIAADVAPDKLARYFFRTDDGSYRVTKAVRDCCVFAKQNLTKDPPFSKLDVISCRNVMIYLGSVLQRKVMSIFHYALRPNGYLLLGNSESVGSFADLFDVVDRRHKIYQKRQGPSRVAFQLEPAHTRGKQERRPEEPASPPSSIGRDADRAAASRYAPTAVIVNEALEILQFRGRTSPFLEPAPGTASFDLLKMAREGLLSELRAAIQAARKTDAPVRRQHIRIRRNEQEAVVDVDIVPFLTSSERYYLIVFADARDLPAAVPAQSEASATPGAPRDDAEILARLNRELDATREYLQSIVEEQEAMNEELRSANEEIQSSNEELQSTNEELETAKEELQSSNEELTTLNEELENRNEELALVNNDLVNILGSVDIPIVIVDEKLRIRRFNAGAQRTLNLIANDVGRTLHDVKLTLQVENLDQLITEVIEHLGVREMAVRDRGGRSYSLRIRPYKTVDNRIEGAVLLLIDLADVGRA